jgi:hypothetical protein
VIRPASSRLDFEHVQDLTGSVSGFLLHQKAFLVKIIGARLLDPVAVEDYPSQDLSQIVVGVFTAADQFVLSVVEFLAEYLSRWA